MTKLSVPELLELAFAGKLENKAYRQPVGEDEKFFAEIKSPYIEPLLSVLGHLYGDGEKVDEDTEFNIQTVNGLIRGELCREFNTVRTGAPLSIRYEERWILVTVPKVVTARVLMSINNTTETCST